MNRKTANIWAKNVENEGLLKKVYEAFGLKYHNNHKTNKQLWNLIEKNKLKLGESLYPSIDIIRKAYIENSASGTTGIILSNEEVNKAILEILEKLKEIDINSFGE